MARYQLYVVDAHGRSVIALDDHSRNGNRCWYINREQPFSIVLESETIATYLMLDEHGDMVIEQEDLQPPEPPPKPKRKSRFNWRKGAR